MPKVSFLLDAFTIIRHLSAKKMKIWPELGVGQMSRVLYQMLVSRIRIRVGPIGVRGSIIIL